MRGVWMRKQVCVALGLSVWVAGCGSSDERTYVEADASSGGTAGSSASGGAGGTGATGGSGGVGGGSGGTAGSSSAGTGGGSGGGSGGSAGGSAGAASCDTSTHACVPATPAGWTGPIAFRSAAGPAPGCPGDYPTKVSDGMSGLDAGQASCSCSCDPATGIGCSGSASIYDVGEGVTGCITNPLSFPKVWQGAPNVCTKALLSSSGQVALIPPTASPAGSCAAKSNFNLPTPTWAEQSRICSGTITPGPGCAAGESCVPQAFAPYELCVYRPGDEACPAGYSQKKLVNDGFQDTRSCSGCSCGAASSSCAGTVSFESSSGCPGLILQTAVTGCGTPVQNVSSAYYGTYLPAPSGTCTPATSTLSGSVVATGDTTVCCLP